MWEVTTVRKSDLDRHLRAGWEPLNASMVQGHSFDGAPVLREFWHLRRWVEVPGENLPANQTMNMRP